jgi:CTP synthase
VVRPGTLAARMFGARARLRFRHRYEVDPRYIPQLEAAGMIFSGKSPRAEIMNLLELRPDLHPYYVGTQAHPELTSRPLSPQPFFVGLVHAALQRAHADFTEPLVYPQEAAERTGTQPPSSEPQEHRVGQV